MKTIIIRILNVIALAIFSMLVFLSIVGIADYQVIWFISLDKLNGLADIVLLIIALCKVFIYFDEDRTSALIGGGLLFFFIVLNQLDQCNYVQLIALIVSMMGIKIEKIAKVYVSVEGTTLILTFVLSAVGVISNEHAETTSRVIKNIYSLGFSNHNPPMALWLMLVLAIVYLTRNSKFRIQVCVGMMALNVLLYVITGSNASFFIGMFILTLAIMDYVIPEKNENNLLSKLKVSFMSGLRLASLYSIFFTVLGICFYGRFGRKGLPLTTLLHRFEIIYWELKLSGLPMPFYTLREAHMADVYFPYFLSDDLESGVYRNVDFNLIRGLGEIKRGQLFSGSDIEYFNILLFDGLMVLLPYVIFSIYLMHKAYKKKEYILMLCIAGSIFYGNFEALKSGYSALQVFVVILLADCNVGHSDYRMEYDEV